MARRVEDVVAEAFAATSFGPDAVASFLRELADRGAAVMLTPPGAGALDETTVRGDLGGTLTVTVTYERQAFTWRVPAGRLGVAVEHDDPEPGGLVDGPVGVVGVLAAVEGRTLGWAVGDPLALLEEAEAWASSRAAEEPGDPPGWLAEARALLDAVAEFDARGDRG